MSKIKKLLVVESPTKAKTIKGYLGKDFDVVASKGHIKDLPENKFGVSIKQGFKPYYIILPGKKKVVQEIQQKAKVSQEVFIGSDPDREGEAIAQHVKEVINKTDRKKNVKRVLFFEITKEEVKNAINNPQEIDINKVNAQQARRILDRIVGYMVSPVLWRILRKGLSAGRVQTVALRLICEREKERERFQPETYFLVKALFEKDGQKFEALLKTKGKLKDKTIVEDIKSKLPGLTGIVETFKKDKKFITPYPPYKTSTLQQDASQKLGFTPKRTMQLAQELYEGVNIQGERKGLITYMRTDSVRISEKAINTTRKVIKDKFGSELLPLKPRKFKEKKIQIQGAHEAIRPTYPTITPSDIQNEIKKELFKLYNLIWKRALASQAKSAEEEHSKATIKVGQYIFEAQGKKVLFPGFYKILDYSPNYKQLPEMKPGDQIKLIDLSIEEKQTEPPARYTEATLIKALEANGVGRPSTYAPTLSTLYQRKYIIKQKSSLVPTELGMLVYEILIPRFKEIFDVEFTARMEEMLDKVENGEITKEELLEQFYSRFKIELDNFVRESKSIKKELEVTEENCPICGAPLVIRWSKYGKFLACSKYPECKYTRPLEMEVAEGIKCPVCGKDMILREGRTGRFYTCIDYPRCPGTLPYTTGVKCPECGGDLIERKNKRGQIFYACSNYPKCKFTLSNKPVPIKCPKCGFNFLVVHKKGRKELYKCIKCNSIFTKEELENG